MKWFLIKWLVILVASAIIWHYLKAWVLLFGFLWIFGLFAGGSSSSKNEGSGGLSEANLDGERDPNWDGRDMNEIFDDSLGDWDLDGKREEKF